MGQTRWPSIFSSLDVIGSHKKQTKLKYFFQIEDFGFPVSREDAYYQFYKNAPTVCVGGWLVGWWEAGWFVWLVVEVGGWLGSNKV